MAVREGRRPKLGFRGLGFRGLGFRGIVSGTFFGLGFIGFFYRDPYLIGLRKKGVYMGYP